MLRPPQALWHTDQPQWIEESREPWRKLREKLRATRAAKAAALTTAVNDALRGFADLRFDEDDFQDPEASDDDALAGEDVSRASEEEARVGAGARVDANASADALTGDSPGGLDAFGAGADARASVGARASVDALGGLDARAGADARSGPETRDGPDGRAVDPPRSSKRSSGKFQQVKRRVMDKLTPEQKEELEKRAAKISKELDDCDEETRQRIFKHCQARGVKLLSERPPSSPAENGDSHEPSLITQVEADKIQAVRGDLWKRAEEWFKKDEKCIQYFNKKPEAMRQMKVIPERPYELPRLAGGSSSGYFGITIGTYPTIPASGARPPMSPWAVPHNPSMKYLFSTQAKIANLTEEEYRGRCGHLDVLPIHLPADADPEKFLKFVQSRDRKIGTNVYGRLLEMNAFLLERIANVCGGSARVQMMGLASLKDNSDNILTRLMRDMYEYEASRAILVGGGLGEDAEALVDAATFCNHPMVYLVPGFHPTNVDNIKRNDFAVACFLSFTFGWLIRPNMARRAFERDPVFSAALAIQNAEHLRRIAGLGGKAQAESGQLAAKAAAGREAQAASGQLARPSGVYKKTGTDKYEVRFKETYIGIYPTIEAARFVWNAAAHDWNETRANPSEKYALWDLSPDDTAKFESRDPRWREPSGVRKDRKDGGKYTVNFNGKRLGVYPTREAGYFVWNAAAHDWNETRANPFEKYALWELSPDDTAKFESRDPRWREPSGVSKYCGKYVVSFNKKRVGVYSSLEAAYFVWNAAAHDWNETRANPFEKYALWELSPDDTAKFESRDPRWREPSGVRKYGGKYYSVNFNGKRLANYPTRAAAYSAWNAVALDWNETRANPFEKYALFPSTPGDEAR